VLADATVINEDVIRRDAECVLCARSRHSVTDIVSIASSHTLQDRQYGHSTVDLHHAVCLFTFQLFCCWDYSRRTV